METSPYIMANINGSKFIKTPSSWEALTRGVITG